MPTVAFVSFRLGGRDGVAIEATKWSNAFTTLGYDVHTVAGDGPVDVLVSGLGIRDERPLDLVALDQGLNADLVIVENLLSLPLNPAAAQAVAERLQAKPAILHHHDLPWQRLEFQDSPGPPQDPHWIHVAINQRSVTELAERGLSATLLYNSFDPNPPAGDRDGLRSSLSAHPGERIALQPTRALERKGIEAAMTACSEIGATFWLLGDAEDGFEEELERVISLAPCPVILGMPSGGFSIHDAYAASDLVVMGSTWEGFGNPVLESATHRRPLLLNRYPIAKELETYGFEWFGLNETEEFEQLLTNGTDDLVAHNAAVAAEHFSLLDLPARLSALIDLIPGGIT
ncbi:MAG: hypothetical protein WCL38_00405 [Actinomycetota bacterium]